LSSCDYGTGQVDRQGLQAMSDGRNLHIVAAMRPSWWWNAL